MPQVFAALNPNESMFFFTFFVRFNSSSYFHIIYPKPKLEVINGGFLFQLKALAWAELTVAKKLELGTCVTN